MKNEEFIKKIVASMNEVLAQENALRSNLPMTIKSLLQIKALLQKRIDLNKELTEVLQKKEDQDKSD